MYPSILPRASLVPAIQQPSICTCTYTVGNQHRPTAPISRAYPPPIHHSCIAFPLMQSGIWQGLGENRPPDRCLPARPPNNRRAVFFGWMDGCVYDFLLVVVGTDSSAERTEILCVVTPPRPHWRLATGTGWKVQTLRSRTCVLVTVGGK